MIFIWQSCNLYKLYKTEIRTQSVTGNNQYFFFWYFNFIDGFYYFVILYYKNLVENILITCRMHYWLFFFCFWNVVELNESYGVGLFKHRNIDHSSMEQKYSWELIFTIFLRYREKLDGVCFIRFSPSFNSLFTSCFINSFNSFLILDSIHFLFHLSLIHSFHNSFNS